VNLLGVPVILKADFHTFYHFTLCKACSNFNLFWCFQ